MQSVLNVNYLILQHPSCPFTFKLRHRKTSHNAYSQILNQPSKLRTTANEAPIYCYIQKKVKRTDEKKKSVIRHFFQATLVDRHNRAPEIFHSPVQWPGSKAAAAQLQRYNTPAAVAICPRLVSPERYAIQLSSRVFTAVFYFEIRARAHQLGNEKARVTWKVRYVSDGRRGASTLWRELNFARPIAVGLCTREVGSGRYYRGKELGNEV